MQDYIHIKPETYIIPNTLDESNKSYIYGEVNPNDIISIINNLTCVNSYSFLDIGSGCGKLVLCINSKFPDMYCVGIEIHNGRYNDSIKWLEQYPNLQSSTEFFNNDFKKHYFGNYDILYCCNVIYSKEDNLNLYKKILSEFTGYIILFEYDHHLKHYLLSSYLVQTSWKKNVAVYLFRL
jgi:hypothetical protein